MKEKIAVIVILIGIVSLVLCRFVLEKNNISTWIFRISGIAILLGIFAKMYFHKRA